MRGSVGFILGAAGGGAMKSRGRAVVLRAMEDRTQPGRRWATKSRNSRSLLNFDTGNGAFKGLDPFVGHFRLIWADHAQPT
jgi:hypothetical protein